MNNWQLFIIHTSQYVIPLRGIEPLYAYFVAILLFTPSCSPRRFPSLTKAYCNKITIAINTKHIPSTIAK